MSILPARGAQEEPRAPRQGCPFSTGTTSRTRPILTGHLQSGLIAGGARRGSNPAWGGRRGKAGREGVTRTPGREAGRPGSCPARSGPAPPASRADPCHSWSRRCPSVAIPQAPSRFPSFWIFWPGNPVPPGQCGGSWRRHRDSGGETVAAKAVAAAAAAATATASAKVNVVPWRCVDALSPRFLAGLLKSLRPACGPGKDLWVPHRAQRAPPCSKGSFCRPKSQLWGVGVLGPFVANLRLWTGSARLGVRSPPFSPPPLPPPAPSLLLARLLW